MDLLIKASMYLSYIMEGYIAYMYFSSMFEHRRDSVTAHMVSYITGFSVLFTVFILGSSAVNMVCSLAVMTVLGVIVFKTGVLKALFHSAVVSVLLVASEFLVISLFNMVFSVNAASINTPPIIVIVSICSKLLLFVGCKFITAVAVKDKYWNKWSPLLFLVPLASMLCMLIIFYQSARLELSVTENVLNCFVSLLLLGANLLVFYVYEHTLRNEQELARIRLSEQRRELDYDYFKMLEENRKESRVIIHDIKHHLNLIRSMAQEKEMSDICEYIDSIQKESYFGKTARLSGNRIVDAILAQKSSICDKNGVKLCFEHNNTNLNFISDSDLCAMLSNALDNAVESAVLSREKSVQLRLYCSGNGCFYFIEVINSCDKKPCKSGQGYKSTKPGKYHGVGLYSIRQAAEKYSGDVTAEYTENNKFRTTIMLQKLE